MIVRAKVQIDPRTAAPTVTTGDIPSIIEGFPLQIKHAYINVNRPGFTFNPTNCSKMEVTGTVNAWEGGSAPVLIPFQAGECRSLTFALDFKVATSGKLNQSEWDEPDGEDRLSGDARSRLGKRPTKRTLAM